MAIRNTLTGANQFSDTLKGEVLFACPEEVNPNHLIDLSISGAWAGTLTLQRRFLDDPEGVWRDTDTFTGNVETTFVASMDGQYRIGFKAGQYTSGTAEIRIGYGVA